MNTRNWWRKTVLFVLGLAGLATLVQCAGPVASVGGVPVEPTMLAVTPAPTKTAVPTGTASPTPYPTMAPFHLTAATEVAVPLPPDEYVVIRGIEGNIAAGIIYGEDVNNMKYAAVIVDLTTGQVWELDRIEGRFGNLMMSGQSISARWVTWYKEVYIGEGSYGERKYESKLMVYDRLEDCKFQLEGAKPLWPGPVLSGDIVVWDQFEPSSLEYRTYARNLVTGQGWIVAKGPHRQNNPYISGLWVIYLEFQEDSWEKRVDYLRAHYLPTGEDFLIGQVPRPNDSSAGTYHTLTGHKVVWCGTSAATGLRGLYVYDLESRNEWPLPLNYVCSGLEPFGDDALVVRGTLVYSLEDGSLLGTIDTSAMEGDVGKVFVSGNRVLVQTIKEEFGGSTFPLYTMQLTH